ncbi:unnamed protein product, partial [Brugia timori]
MKKFLSCIICRESCIQNRISRLPQCSHKNHPHASIMEISGGNRRK